MADSEMKRHDLLDMLLKESGENGLTINCEKTISNLNSKRKSSCCELRIEDIYIKRMQKFKYV